LNRNGLSAFQLVDPADEKWKPLLESMSWNRFLAKSSTGLVDKGPQRGLPFPCVFHIGRSVKERVNFGQKVVGRNFFYPWNFYEIVTKN
jgi:hypothetical protein